MATQVHYQTLNNQGVDVTQYYVVSASVTPETPAPPFLVGTRAFGSDGSEFVFVQASTTINNTDFVVLNIAAPGAGYQANSITNTNVTSSLAVGLASTGLVKEASVTYIPAGAYFWALTKGQFIPAGSSAGLASNASGVALYSTASGGVLSSVTTSRSLSAAFQGIVCINSLTVSIPSSVIPAGLGPARFNSNGYTIGPVVNMNNPRPNVTLADSGTLIAGANLQIWSF